MEFLTSEQAAQQTLNRLQAINGYPETFSVAVGELVQIRAARSPVKGSRELGPEGSLGPRIKHCEIIEAVTGTSVAQFTPSAAASLPVQRPASYRGNGADYSFAFPLSTHLFSSGVYECRITDESGAVSSDIYFNLRSAAPAPRGALDAVVVLPTFTWHAYNAVGGGSFYTSEIGPVRTISLKRPVSFGPLHSMRGTLPFLNLFREIGLNLACIDSLDLHLGNFPLDQAPMVILVGHDEYWSADMRARMDSYIRAGGILLVLGGNTCWWRVAVEGSELTVCKGLNKRFDHWHMPHINYPEEITFGSSYKFGGYPVQRIAGSESKLNRFTAALSADDVARSRSLVARATDHPVFAGVELPPDRRFGGNVPILHGEIDAVRLDATGNVDRDICPGVPRETKVLAVGDVVSWLVQPQGVLEVGVMIESRVGSGTVLNFGSFGWLPGIAQKDPTIRQIVINAVNYCRNLAAVPPPETEEWEIEETETGKAERA